MLVQIEQYERDSFDVVAVALVVEYFNVELWVHAQVQIAHGPLVGKADPFRLATFGRVAFRTLEWFVGFAAVFVCFMMFVVQVVLGLVYVAVWIEALSNASS